MALLGSDAVFLREFIPLLHSQSVLSDLNQKRVHHTLVGGELWFRRGGGHRSDRHDDPRRSAIFPDLNALQVEGDALAFFGIVRFYYGRGAAPFPTW